MISLNIFIFIIKIMLVSHFIYMMDDHHNIFDYVIINIAELTYYIL